MKSLLTVLLCALAFTLSAQKTTKSKQKSSDILTHGVTPVKKDTVPTYSTPKELSETRWVVVTYAIPKPDSIHLVSTAVLEVEMTVYYYEITWPGKETPERVVSTTPTKFVYTDEEKTKLNLDVRRILDVKECGYCPKK